MAASDVGGLGAPVVDCAKAVPETASANASVDMNTPEWRGFEFVRVRNQILVVDPATYEIVAILDV